jgi:DNA-binding MarR family transcriptional regulator
MQPDFEIPLPGLLNIAAESIRDELYARLREGGYPELRPAHSCVFGTIGRDGDRLTALAERADMTKQAVGEVASELEAIGYVERVPDPSDGRAKIIRLTERGREAYEIGFGIFDEIRDRWAERYGADRVDGMVELLNEIVADVRFGPPEAAPRRAA